MEAAAPARRAGSAARARPSVLDRVGEEISSVVVPVSICMALTVALVRYLMPHGARGSGAVGIASVYYHEDSGDSAGTKLEGSLINSLIFIGIIGAMTFVLFLMFKYRCTKVIYGYFGFAGFSIFAVLGGSVAVQVLLKANIAVDVITCGLVLYNFAVGGVLFTFYFPAPLLLKQGYLVLVGTIVAFWFSKIPEWTTWMLLAAMSLYDLCAVLAPGGPLKALVELAEEREEDIPALVYEARPTSSTRSLEELEEERARAAWRRRRREAAARETGEAESEAAGLAEVAQPPPPVLSADPPPSPPGEHADESGAGEEMPLLRDGDREGSDGLAPDASPAAAGREAEPTAGQQGRAAPTPSQQRASPPQPPPPGVDGALVDDDEAGLLLPDSIKLGLGDFIFYSVLVGRAAMYDMSTVAAAYLAIVAGLGATLLLLAVFQKALPALPISIAMGMLFYFVTRFLLEPFATSLAVSLVWV